MRPMLGTLIAATLAGAEGVDEAISDAFLLAGELERLFSKFRDDSLLNQINNAPVGTEIPLEPLFAEALASALEIREISESAFDIFGGAPLKELPLRYSADMVVKIAPCRLDLTGLAKGFVVDQMVEHLSRFSGVVNAGGDLRFFNSRERVADLRFASGTRHLEMTDAALATSSMLASRQTGISTTTYFLKPRLGLSIEHSVSTMAPTCAVADALCKVGWFAPAETIRRCVRHFHARVITFDAQGEPTEEFA